MLSRTESDLILLTEARTADDGEYGLLLGTLTEAIPQAAGDTEHPPGTFWRVQIIDAGVSLNGFDYPLSVLHEASHLFEGSKVMSRSDGEHRANKDVDNEDAVGWLKDVRGNSTGLEGVLVLHGGGKSAGLRESIYNAWKLGKKDLLGLSIVAKGAAARGELIGGRVVQAIKKIVRVASTDIVVNPAAGGRFLDLVAGVDPQNKESENMNLEKLLKLIEAHDPEGYKRIDLKAIDEKLVLELGAALTESMITKAADLEVKLTESQKPKPAEQKKDPDPAPTGELAELKSALVGLTEAMKTNQKGESETMARLNAMEFDRVFDKMLAESRLPDESKDAVLRRIDLKDRTASETKALTEAITAEEVYYFGREGFQGPESSLTEARAYVAADEQDKFSAALTGLFTQQDEPVDAKNPKDTVPRMTSIREAYVAATGDFNVTGRLPRNTRLVMVREAAQTLNAQWGYILGDSVTRAMMQAWEASDLLDCMKIVKVVPVKDFRTQHRTQVGGFPTLSTVTAGSDYVGFTDVPEDYEATYAISKKGNFQKITMEMIANDDVGELQDMPMMLAESAAHTRSEAIWTLLTGNASIYDSTALFHADHSNTGTFEAMSGPAIIARRTAMMKQTRLAGVDATAGKRIQIRPKFIMAAVDLEQRMFELTGAAGKPVLDQSVAAASDSTNIPNFISRMSLEPIVIPHLTDTNDWFMCADPRKTPTIELGVYNGKVEPELFIQDDPSSGSMFSADCITYKIRQIDAAAVMDYRGLQGMLS